eukprot:5176888-Alexandrium_andersonii.AAC.1
MSLYCRAFPAQVPAPLRACGTVPAAMTALLKRIGALVEVQGRHVEKALPHVPLPHAHEPEEATAAAQEAMP